MFKSPPGRETEQAVRWALEIGYRHVDTAAYYQNEADVGRALKDSRVPRETVFVTTKVWNQDQGFQSTLRRTLQKQQEGTARGWSEQTGKYAPESTYN